MQPVYSRTNPFPGKMVVNRLLNEGNRNKETRHHEISLAGSGLTFEPGDSMAVCASNDPPLVEEIIRALGATGDEIVPTGKNETAPLRKAWLRPFWLSAAMISPFRFFPVWPSIFIYRKAMPTLLW